VRGGNRITIDGLRYRQALSAKPGFSPRDLACG
jgi:hypothetical protein